MSKVLVISTTLRKDGNSYLLAQNFAKGAESTGHQVELISLIDKEINFCKGCLVCQKTGKCVINDDANEITEKILISDIIAWATPIYYYEMSGQMKTLIDRANSMYPKDYKFKDIYLLATAAENEETAMDGAIKGIQGWIDCYEKSELKGVLKAIGICDIGDIKTSTYLQQAYELGTQI